MAAGAEDEDQAGDGNTDYEKIVSRRGLHFDRASHWSGRHSQEAEEDEQQ